MTSGNVLTDADRRGARDDAVRHAATARSRGSTAPRWSSSSAASRPRSAAAPTWAGSPGSLMLVGLRRRALDRRSCRWSSRSRSCSCRTRRCGARDDRDRTPTMDERWAASRCGSPGWRRSRTARSPAGDCEDATALIERYRRSDATFHAGHFHNNWVQIAVTTGARRPARLRGVDGARGVVRVPCISQHALAVRGRGVGRMGRLPGVRAVRLGFRRRRGRRISSFSGSGSRCAGARAALTARRWLC